MSCQHGLRHLALGAPHAVFVGGAWATVAAGGLKLLSEKSLHGTELVLGDFSGTELSWTAFGVPFITSVRNYGSGATVALEYSFPRGLEVSSASEGVLTNFPAFAKVDMAHALSWQGEFMTPHACLTFGSSGGPAVWFDDPQGTTLLLAPANHFHASSAERKMADGTDGEMDH